MKKLFLPMLTILTCGAAYALPVGNPADASLLSDGLIWEGMCGCDPCDPCLTLCDAFSVRVGFYGDYVFNRHMEIELDDDNGGPDIEHFQLWTNAGLITANVWDRLDLFATLGTTSMNFETSAGPFLGDDIAPGNRVELETSTSFSWSLGARGTIWECGCTYLGAEAQYFRSRMPISRYSVVGSGISVYPSGIDARYREWQVGLGLAHRINMIVPYIAVQYARAHCDFGDAVIEGGDVATLANQINKKRWAYAIGATIVDCEKLSLTVEARFAGEKAVHVNGQIRF